MPDNLGEPSHVLMRKVAARRAFSRQARRRERGARADRRIRRLLCGAGACLRADRHVAHDLCASAQGPDAIVEWVAGTGLRPFLAPLAPDERQAFLARYRDEIAAAYPPLADGRRTAAVPAAVHRGAARRRGPARLMFR